VKRTRERYRKNDEKVKLTSKTIMHSTLGKIGMEFLMADIQSGIINPKIGKPFNRGNVDPAKNNLGEPSGESSSSYAHLEYAYRIANKAISGDPEQPFSLDPTILKTGNPQAIADTQSKIVTLLTIAGILGATGSVNKEEVRKHLNAPVEEQQDQ
jgi:hypothetical protein